MSIACDQRPSATNGFRPFVAGGLWSQAIHIGLVWEGTSQSHAHTDCRMLSTVISLMSMLFEVICSKGVAR